MRMIRLRTIERDSREGESYTLGWDVSGEEDWVTEEGDVRPGARVVVWVNGFSRPRSDFRGLRQSLTSADGSIVSVSLDNRGVGESEGGVANLTITAMAEDVCSIVEHIWRWEPQCVVLAGVSMGGMVVWETAQRSRCSGLILVTTGKAEGRPPESLEEYLGQEFRAKYPLRVRTLLKQVQETRRALGKTLEAQRRAIETHMSFEGICSCPSLVVWGDDDRIIAPQASQDLLKSLPQGYGVAYEGVGHMVLVEAAQRLAEDVVTFLQRC